MGVGVHSFRPSIFASSFSPLLLSHSLSILVPTQILISFVYLILSKCPLIETSPSQLLCTFSPHHLVSRSTVSSVLSFRSDLVLLRLPKGTLPSPLPLLSVLGLMPLGFSVGLLKCEVIHSLLLDVFHKSDFSCRVLSHYVNQKGGVWLIYSFVRHICINVLRPYWPYLLRLLCTIVRENEFLDEVFT